MIKKIVLTGGTYAGKSALLRLFEQDGYSIIPDIGFEVLTELNAQLGEEQQKAWRENNPLKFYENILKKQLTAEESAVDGEVILDRGVYDYIGMMQVKRIKVPPSFYELARRTTRYTQVFVLDTLSNFSERVKSGRSLSKTDSLQLNKYVTEMYAQLGYNVVPVREMSLKERYDYIRSLI